MTSDLDKYGLVALTIIVVLILFIAMNDLQDESDPALNGIRFDDSELQLSEEAPEDLPELLVEPEVETPQAGRQDFDFSEGPVDYPGAPAEEAEEAASPAAAFIRHTVRKGEMLSTISRRYLGSAKHWRTIAAANPGLDPDNLQIGDELNIPRGIPSNPAPVQAPEGREETSAYDRYEVKKGDTLGKIAQRVYGSAGAWNKIYAANRGLIQDPRNLKIGSVLRIPR